MKRSTSRAYGWVPDLPDRRDLIYGTKKPVAISTLPKKVDFRGMDLPSVEDQGQLGSCTANALVSCLEILECRKTGTNYWTDLSRLYLYYYERVMLNMVEEDSGAYLRDGIKVLAKRGVPEEEYWPYTISRYKVRPPEDTDIDAQKHRIKKYRRIERLYDMLHCLSEGVPFAFGFSVYASFEGKEIAKTGVMKMPGRRERMLGGHAVCAVGYDRTRNVLIVRNSWGDWWGDKGYFYMPFAYVESRYLSDDFWAITG